MRVLFGGNEYEVSNKFALTQLLKHGGELVQEQPTTEEVKVEKKPAPKKK